jgi:putative FmdB family regulatory protein
VPTYEYACTACDERLEVVQKFTDAPLTECPVCHGRLRKVFSPVGVLFKGSGFYRTDSRSKGTREKALETAKAGDSSGSPDSSGSSGSSGSSNSSGSSSDTSAPKSRASRSPGSRSSKSESAA